MKAKPFNRFLRNLSKQLINPKNHISHVINNIGILKMCQVFFCEKNYID